MNFTLLHDITYGVQNVFQMPFPVNATQWSFPVNGAQHTRPAGRRFSKRDLCAPGLACRICLNCQRCNICTCQSLPADHVSADHLRPQQFRFVETKSSDINWRFPVTLKIYAVRRLMRICLNCVVCVRICLNCQRCTICICQSLQFLQLRFFLVLWLVGTPSESDWMQLLRTSGSAGSLTELIVDAGYGFTDACCVVLASRFGHLTRLGLRYCSVTDSGLGELHKLANLQHLEIDSSPGITDEGLGRVITRGTLTSLILDDNNGFTGKFLERRAPGLPELLVEFRSCESVDREIVDRHTKRFCWPAASTV